LLELFSIVFITTLIIIADLIITALLT